MAPSKLRNAIGAVKDRTSIGLARVSNSASISDLEVAIVKATRHEDYPPEERHIREVLSLTCYSHAFVGACVDTISRRLSKTKNWIVALKTLMLIHRLLTDGDPAYVQEIFFATRRGTRLLNMSDFSDKRTNSWDYSALVRTFAMYLDERLEFMMQKRRGKHGGCSGVEEDDAVDDDQAAAATGRATPVRELTTERLFSRVQHLMRLLERFLACRPTGPAKHNTIVIMALYPVVKESFQIYYDVTEILTILISRFTELQVQDGVKVYEIFCRASKQFEDLDSFYGWCKNTGMARSSELPEVDRITQKKLDLMDEYIREKSNDQFADDKVLYLEDQKHEPEEEEEEDKKSEALAEDMNATAALPAPEEPEKEEKKEEVDDNNDNNTNNNTQQEADLLNLGEDSVTVEEHGDKLALALFDGPPSSNGTLENSTTAWEAFKDTENWETALVQSASHLPNQKTSLPGGFDMMMLDGMYQQGATIQAMASSGYNATGSRSSVAFGSAGRPAMLALPAPPAAAAMANSSSAGGWTNSVDPFERSLSVPPPPYVQMTEMEKKQRLLMEEQLMWQQYARDGMQGQVGLTKVQPPSYHPYPYNMGGYTRTY